MICLKCVSTKGKDYREIDKGSKNIDAWVMHSWDMLHHFVYFYVSLQIFVIETIIKCR